MCYSQVGSIVVHWNVLWLFCYVSNWQHVCVYHMCSFYLSRDVAVVGGSSTLLRRRIKMPTMTQSTTDERIRDCLRDNIRPLVQTIRTWSSLIRQHFSTSTFLSHQQLLFEIMFLAQTCQPKSPYLPARIFLHPCCAHIGLACSDQWLKHVYTMTWSTANFSSTAMWSLHHSWHKIPCSLPHPSLTYPAWHPYGEMYLALHSRSSTF